MHQIHVFVGQTGHYAFCLGPAGVSYTQFCKFILGHGSCSSMSGNNIPAYSLQMAMSQSSKRDKLSCTKFYLQMEEIKI